MNLNTNINIKSLGNLLDEFGSFRLMLPEFQKDYKINEEDILETLKLTLKGSFIPQIVLYRPKDNKDYKEILVGQELILFCYFAKYNLFFKNQKSKTYNLSLSEFPIIDKKNWRESRNALKEELNSTGNVELLKKAYLCSESLIEKINSEFSKYKTSLWKLNFIIIEKDSIKDILEIINHKKSFQPQQIREYSNYDLFEYFYKKENELDFLYRTNKKYELNEFCFKLLFYYFKFNNSKFWSNLNKCHMDKHLLDKCNELLKNDREKQNQFISIFDNLIKLKNYEEFIHSFKGKKQQKFNFILSIFILENNKIEINSNNIEKLRKIVNEKRIKNYSLDNILKELGINESWK